MRVRGLGHIMFALGLAGIGVLSLFSGHFAYSWEPVPMGLPWRAGLARNSTGSFVQTSCWPVRDSRTVSGASSGDTITCGATRNVCSSANWPESTACGTVSV